MRVWNSAFSAKPSRLRPAFTRAAFSPAGERSEHVRSSGATRFSRGENGPIRVYANREIELRHRRAKPSGYAFSVDALLALALLVGFLVFGQVVITRGVNSTVAVQQQSLDDAFTSLDNSGFLLYATDASGSTADAQAQTIYAKSIGLIPAGYDLRVEIQQFDYNPQACRAGQNFDSCFILSGQGSAGVQVPVDRSIISGKKLIVKKQSHGDCNVSPELSLSENDSLHSILRSPFNAPFRFSSKQFDSIFFAAATDTNLSIDFNAALYPSGVPIKKGDVLSCDQTVKVDINAWFPSVGRNLIDSVLVVDRSGSMSWDGQASTSNALAVALQGTYAFIADGTSGNMADINVLVPLNPNVVGTYNRSGTANDVAVQGNVAFLANTSTRLDIVNITNKNAPSTYATLSQLGNGTGVDANESSFAFVVTSSDGAGAFYDLNTQGGAAQNVFAAIGQNTSKQSGAQSFVPLSNLVSGADVYLSRVGNNPGDVTVRLRSTISGSDLATATISDNDIGTSYAFEIADFGQNVSVTPGQTYYLVITDASNNNSNYTRWGGSNANPYANGIAYQGTSTTFTNFDSNDLFVRVWRRAPAGLQVVDASTPSAPQHLGTAPFSSGEKVDVVGSYAYVARGTSGLSIVSVANPANPTLLGTYNSPGTAYNVFVNGNYAYVGDGTSGLIIVDVSNPSLPISVGTYNTPGTARGVFVTNNRAYVADSTSLQAIDVSNPSAPVFLRSYATPFVYRDVVVSNNIAYIASGSAYGLFTFDLTAGPKIDQVKTALSPFIDFSGWTVEDKMGLVSFSGSATLNRTLVKLTDANKNLLKQDVNALVASGSTAIGDGISTATAELNSARHTPDARKFQILLSDGQNTAGSDPLTAAQNAKDSNIIIYTIAFGIDADLSTMQQIAALTDGNSFIASDENSLLSLYLLIAQQIGSIATGTEGPVAPDVNITISLDPGTVVQNISSTFQGTCQIDAAYSKGVPGACTETQDTNALFFELHDINIISPWYGSYLLTYPCNSDVSCKTNTRTIPETGSVYEWKDSNGISHPSATFDQNHRIDVNFLYRDFNISFVSALLVDLNRVDVNLRVDNNGDLNQLLPAVPIPANIFVDQDPRVFSGNPLSPPSPVLFPKWLCGSHLYKGPGCPTQDSASATILSEGTIYAFLDANTLRDCPRGNTAAIRCSSGPFTQFYQISYHMWRK